MGISGRTLPSCIASEKEKFNQFECISIQDIHWAPLYEQMDLLMDKCVLTYMQIKHLSFKLLKSCNLVTVCILTRFLLRVAWYGMIHMPGHWLPGFLSLLAVVVF